jgi:hypothetical protein
MVEFKSGDKVIKAKRYNADKYCRWGGESEDVPIGTKGIVRCLSTSVGGVIVDFENGKDWTLDSCELVLDNGKNKFKEVPIVKHLILQDSCGNFCAVKNSEKEAIDFAKTYNKENLTIYRMVEIAKVTTKIDRKVVKVKAKRVKK